MNANYWVFIRCHHGVSGGFQLGEQVDKVPVYWLSKPWLVRICGFAIHQGLTAVVRKTWLHQGIRFPHRLGNCISLQQCTRFFSDFLTWKSLVDSQVEFGDSTGRLFSPHSLELSIWNYNNLFASAALSWMERAKTSDSISAWFMFLNPGFDS